MPIFFKLISSGLEYKWENIIKFNLKLIYDFFLSNDIKGNELNNITFIIDNEEINSFNITYTINSDENAYIYVYTKNVYILEKLTNIFKKYNLHEMDIDLLMVDSPVIIKQNTVPKLTDEIIDEMNKKSVELFIDPDFRSLIRIYMNKPELFSIMAKYIQSGNVIEESLNQKEISDNFHMLNIEEQNKYIDLSNKIKELGINCDDNIIYNKLRKYSGHLNLTIRDLLCDFANIS